MSKKYKFISVLGDLNCDLDGNTEHAKDIRNFAAMYGLRHFIHVPTRITPTSRSKLDNILSNIHPYEISTGTVDLDIADHCGIYMTINNKKTNNSIKHTRRNINSRTLENFAKSILDINWSDLKLELLQANEMCKKILEIFKDNTDSCFPTKYCQIRNKG
ncbi:unnamed protein product, partial [Psylliodes chrysocephalus]